MAEGVGERRQLAEGRIPSQPGRYRRSGVRQPRHRRNISVGVVCQIGTAPERIREAVYEVGARAGVAEDLLGRTADRVGVGERVPGGIKGDFSLDAAWVGDRGGSDLTVGSGRVGELVGSSVGERLLGHSACGVIGVAYDDDAAGVGDRYHPRLGVVGVCGLAAGGVGNLDQAALRVVGVGDGAPDVVARLRDPAGRVVSEADPPP